MDFFLTSSQKSFYTGNTDVDSVLWNQGVMQVFPQVYSYEKLNGAYNLLVKANDSLRIRIKKDDTEKFLQLEDFQTVNFPLWKVSSEEELMKKAYSFLNEPLKLHERLVKCAVFQTPYSSGIMISGHHIVVDGYSAFVMSEHINNYLADENFVPPAQQRYLEYVSNEEKHKTTRRYFSDTEFWKNQFSCKPVCSLFAHKKNSYDYNSSEVNSVISAELFDKIKSFCSSNNISVQTFFNTIYAIHIYRNLGFENFTIGVPVLNRTTEAELNTIGLYMHIVPLVIKIGDISFSDMVAEIEDSLLNLFRHQKFTQYDIKETLKNNGININQLFDVVFDYQVFNSNNDYEMRLPYSNRLSLPLEIHLQSFNEKKHNLKIRYRTAMFTETEIQTMLSSIINISKDAIENPGKNINDLNIVSDEEKRKILFSFNDTSFKYDVPENSTLYSLFEKTAKENIKKTCITTAERTITFGELLTLSENLDVKIRGITGNKKSIIAVIAERSVEMYSAIYGIIRGGNAYLPIDPDYPTDRIDYILKNSGASAVMAQNRFTHLAGDTPCIDMTAFIENNSVGISSDTPCAAEEADTAYVIYTSGSTGSPKGAKISHKSAVNRILWMCNKYPLCSDDVILQKTPYTFDVSVWELFWWGMCGGSLAVSKPGEHFLPAKILDETYSNKVTHLHFVPSVFDLFLNYLEAHKEELYKFESVKYVFLSGEALTASLVQRFYSLYSYEKVTLHNLYGPTECAVDVTYYDCTPAETDPIPIGKPIYNTQMYITDKHMNPVPLGVTGELCIAGINVGQGYLNNSELTAQKFIDNPFGKGKLYKTGDLAYWREDGQIVFCGRIDNQIKLNGQRIEIGEIETVIGQVSGVESACVIVKKLNEKGVMVAFYCGKSDIEKTILDFCESKLPKYMVPSVVCHIESMPLNSSGKLDRKFLSSLEVTVTDTDTFEEPADKTEAMICDYFAEALNQGNIGRNSDFFSLGGSSLSMISLLSKDEFHNISAAEFMSNSTPAKLALLISSKEKGNFKYLETLFRAECDEKALVLFPFAGGNAESYINIVKSFKRKSNNLSVYFVRYLHTDCECTQAAEEIKSAFENKDVYFYSHCVGAAVAMKILNYLESDDTTLVKHYIAGAIIPQKKPSDKNIWDRVSDKVLKHILIKAGAPLDSLSPEKVSEMLSQFRNDTNFSTEYFSNNPPAVKCPVNVVMSKKDMFTLNYRQAEKNWKRYADTVSGIHFINSSTHYFQSQNSDELADSILSVIN